MKCTFTNCHSSGIKKDSSLFVVMAVACCFLLSCSNRIEHKVTQQTVSSAGLNFPASGLRFDFGSGALAKGYVQVLPTTGYSKQSGYGIISKSGVSSLDYGGGNALGNDFISSSEPFYFVVDLPEGNYKVKVLLGDKKVTSETTVKAESRRLMLEKVRTNAGELQEHTFVVNVRTPRISAAREIILKPREKDYLNWDDKLSLEFNGKRPCVAALEITKVEDVTTLYLAGNSTVVDQEYEPWAAWGQMIPRFFNQEVVIANYAESGEALKSFVAERRLEKIMSVIKPGDYLFIEFAHNDQKPGASHVEAFTTYKEQLKLFIHEARSRRAHPVLVTSMHRRRFDSSGKIINTLEDYPEALRQTAMEAGVPLIDLNEMSKVFYEALGPEESKKAFVHYPAGTFPGQEQALKDDTHFSTYGAYQLAKCVVEGIKKNKLEIAKHLREDVKFYDPANPDPVEEWILPLSPDVTVLKPDGN